MERRLAIVSFTRVADNQVRENLARQVPWETLVRVLSHHETREQKDGWLWSPVRFKHGTTQRLAANVAWVDCLVLDIESGEGPEVYADRFAPYTHLIHTTHSHRPDAPRWRAVFPLAEPCQADRWREIVWPKLTTALTDGRVDPTCKDIARMYFLPSHPPEAPGHFARAHQGDWLRESDFPDPPPPETRRMPPAGGSGGGGTLHPYGSDDRVNPEIVVEGAMQEARETGRNAGALRLFTQLRDNGYTPHEALLIGLHSYLPRLWSHNTKGKEEPWTEGRLEAVWSYAYSKNPRQPWTRLAPPALLPAAARESLPAPSPPAPERVAVEPPAKIDVDGVKIENLGSESSPGPERAADSGFRSDALDRVYTAVALSERSPGPIGFVADPLLPEGLVILHGHAKIGKSMAGLAMAAEVALGEAVFGMFDCRGGAVLYVAREDSPRRIHARLSAYLPTGAPWPERLYLAHDWPPMDERGLSLLTRWLEQTPEASMIVLDPWTAMRPEQRSRDIVLADRRPLEHLDALAHRFRVTVLVIHHSALRSTGDAVNDASGTSGVVQPASAVYQLLAPRGERIGILKGAAKDAMDLELPLVRNPRTGFWSVSPEMGADRLESTWSQEGF